MILIKFIANMLQMPKKKLKMKIKMIVIIEVLKKVLIQTNITRDSKYLIWI